MTSQTISLNDSFRKNLKEVVSVASGRPHGEVSIFEKSKTGALNRIGGKSNMIVFGGREWLLRRAFASSLSGNNGSSDKILKWFGAGNGGGESGNPLQAGATCGQDATLYNQVRLRSDLVNSDPGYSMYSSDYLGNYGYYKTFSSVTIREDRGNPFTTDGVTSYPPLIAEVRIELSSDDCVGNSYEDLNEAALFVSDPTGDPGTDYHEGESIGTLNVLKVVTDADYAIYYLDTENLAQEITPSTLSVGDYLWVDGVPDINAIPQTSPAMIVDIFNGESSVKKAYVVVEKAGAMDSDYGSAPALPAAHLFTRTITPYIMFSRVTFSSIRKTVDRELVFLWKIYF